MTGTAHPNPPARSMVAETDFDRGYRLGHRLGSRAYTRSRWDYGFAWGFFAATLGFFGASWFGPIILGMLP